MVYDSHMNIVEYMYQPDTKTYLRFREGDVMKDELTSTSVTPTNIIVQIADSYVYDAAGKAFHLTGEGKGYYFTGGKQIEIIGLNQNIIPDQLSFIH